MAENPSQPRMGAVMAKFIAGLPTNLIKLVGKLHAGGRSIDNIAKDLRAYDAVRKWSPEKVRQTLIRYHGYEPPRRFVRTQSRIVRQRSRWVASIPPTGAIRRFPQ